MDSRRLQRVSEAMREELDEIINYELSDPRIGEVSVTEVHLSPDSHMAHVTLRLPGDEASRRATFEALRHATGFIRHQLAERIELFRVPELRFEPDSAVDPNRIGPLMRRIRRGRPREERDTP
jgi:ribosome-binding factor A